MAKLMYPELIFERKHEFKAENLTGTQSFPSFWGGGPFVL